MNEKKDGKKGRMKVNKRRGIGETNKDEESEYEKKVREELKKKIMGRAE